MSGRTPTSDFKGVSWHQAGKKWLARIYINSKQKSLGLHDTLEDAAEFYDKTRKEYLKIGNCNPIISKRTSGRPRKYESYKKFIEERSLVFFRKITFLCRT